MKLNSILFTSLLLVAALSCKPPQGDPGPSGQKGPQGDQGVAGKDGPQGPQGPTGLPGAIGPVGQQGAAGANGAYLQFNTGWITVKFAYPQDMQKRDYVAEYVNPSITKTVAYNSMQQVYLRNGVSSLLSQLGLGNRTTNFFFQGSGLSASYGIEEGKIKLTLVSLSNSVKDPQAFTDSLNAAKFQINFSSIYPK